MTPYTQQQIEERFNQLPGLLKENMMSIETAERIFEVGKKFGLTVEQIGSLAAEAGNVVLGLTHPKDFVNRLSDALRTDIEKTKGIAQEINHQIFFPLREALKSTHQFELTQEQIQKPPLAPLPPKIPTASQSSTAPSASQTTTNLPVSETGSNAPSIPRSPSPAPSAEHIRKQSPSLPSQAPQPITSTPVSPPSLLSPTQDIRPPLATLTPSAIQEKKTGITPTPSISAPSLVSKSAEELKPKESMSASALSPAEPSQISLPPSQIMQKKFLEEKERKDVATEPEIQRMKESLFSPASAPAEKPAQTQPTSPEIVPQQSNASPKPAAPSSYSNSDPYREPIE